MSRVRKTWQQKLSDAKAKPDLPKKFFCEKAKQNFVVPSAADVEQIIRRIPKGRLITLQQVCEKLRVKYSVDRACPIVTGIMSWLIANAAEEAPAAKPAPWWRVLKTGGLLNPKYPGAGVTQKHRLQDEGHRIIRKGKNLAVANYEKAVVA